MARYVRTRRFEGDWQALTSEQRKAFVAALLNFDADLAGNEFRPSLGVKAVQGASRAFEMSWAPDGRATFEYGDSASPERVVIWRRVASQEVFRRP
jgi:hypothetical protein